MKRTTVTLPDDLAALAESEARRRHTSVSEIVRESLAEKLCPTAAKPRVIPWIGIGRSSGPPHARDLEKFLEENWADDIARDRG